MIQEEISDPYIRCEEEFDEDGEANFGTGNCTHDLSRGVSARDLMGDEDGPKGVWHPLLNNIIEPDFDPATGEDFGPGGPPPTGIILPESYTRRVRP